MSKHAQWLLEWRNLNSDWNKANNVETFNQEDSDALFQCMTDLEELISRTKPTSVEDIQAQLEFLHQDIKTTIQGPIEPKWENILSTIQSTLPALL